MFVVSLPTRRCLLCARLSLSDCIRHPSTVYLTEYLGVYLLAHVADTVSVQQGTTIEMKTGLQQLHHRSHVPSLSYSLPDVLPIVCGPNGVECGPNGVEGTNKLDPGNRG